MGYAFAVVGILVSLGHEAGAENTNAQIMRDTKFTQSFSNSLTQFISPFCFMIFFLSSHLID